ncbi:ABC transporter ATP-binding protein [Thauera sp.]
MSLLHACKVSKRYGGLQALDDISFEVEQGEIFGLIGPNGAGKTTLFNLLTGSERADNGHFTLGGERLPAGPPHAVARCGIARSFQNTRLFRELSVLENAMVAADARARIGLWATLAGTRAARAEEAACRASALCWLDYVGIAHLADAAAGTLSYGDQRRLEIARALAGQPRLLALDEPAAGMNATETGVLKRLLERIRADGVTIVLIEHDMSLVMAACDRIAVLDFGRLIAQGTPAAVRHDPVVIAAYLGGSHAR